MASMLKTLPAVVAFAATISPLQASPERIVSLAPNLTQMVLELGAGDKLAAVTPFCAAPREIPRVQGGIQPEAESVMQLEPDLVLATSMTPATTRGQLARLGCRIELIDAGSLPAIRVGMDKIASLLDRANPVPPERPAAEKTYSAVLLFGADTAYSAGCGTHAHEILEEAGLRNIAAETSSPWPQLGEEFLLASDPEIIVIADYRQADRESVLALLRAHPVRRHLTAVREGRVVVMPAAAFSVPGPAALQAGESLRAEVAKL